MKFLEMLRAGMRKASEPDTPKSEPVPMRRSAVISEDGLYRYCLGRQWDLAKPGIVWIMLNPSTADAETDDNTIRRCVAFSTKWGFGTLNVVNLFAYRATDPKDLLRAHMRGIDIVGRQNLQAIGENVAVAALIVAAWGTPPIARGAAIQVYNGLLKRMPQPLVCLGITKNGSPRHPLYVPDNCRVLKWGMK
jgi:hypothetical protein